MNKYGVYHMTEAPYAYGKDKDTLTVRIRTAGNDIKRVIVCYKDKYVNDKPYEEKDMVLKVKTDLFDYFQTDIQLFRNRYSYYFKLIDSDDNEAFLNERGVKENLDSGIYPYSFPYIAEDDLYEEVKWLQESTAYQIFPERFCNGDKSINPEGVLPWGGKVTYSSRYGGDIQGIIDKLDYLKELGIDLIYLTPVFKSNTAHKYNTTDYFDIDPQFGNLDKMKELVKACHEKGMKIILDAVFNHSGDKFFAFQDIVKNQDKSKYKDWYFIDKYPLSFEKGGYYTFGDDHRNMPKFNIANKEVKEYLLKVCEFWIKDVHIDGWRLDVCDEVSHDFWRAFKKRVKEVNKDVVVVGEVMNKANAFLKGDQFDGIMNYPFKDAMTDFFAKRTIDVKEFSYILAENRILYMDSVTRQLWNLIDSHDTSRFLTDCNENIKAMKLAIGFQFSYIGVPYIYYGDEVGLNGEDDPQNRKCMIWDKENQNLDLFNFYKKIIEMRKKNKELIYGDYKELFCKDNIIVFERELEGNTIIVMINNNFESKSIELPFKINGYELVEDKQVSYNEKIELESMEMKIIKIARS